MTELVIWAQTPCRSTMALYREMKRQAGVPVVVVLSRNARGESIRKLRESQGQQAGEFDDAVDVEWDGRIESGRSILAAHSGNGSAHVFSGYQTSVVVRRLIREAHSKGCFTAEYDEAPCEMCTGLMASFKRLYYRFILPRIVRRTTANVDMFFNASGQTGTNRLVRIGWERKKIVPFGYASDVRHESPQRETRCGRLRILHTGAESAYRDTATLKAAVRILRRQGVDTELEFTAGQASASDLRRLYEWADVFVACGLCEPWGMRVNDAIHAGLPVFVSSGMGSKWLVEQFECGCAFEKGDPHALAGLLARYANDAGWRERLAAGVSAAHKAWTPEARAKAFLDILQK